MTDRSERNQDFLDTLFLDGGNATYLEQMQARYAANPNSVDPSFRAYFDSLGEDSRNAKKNAEGPVWKREAYTSDPTPDLTSALTGDWGDAAPSPEKVRAAKPSLSDSEAEQGAKDSLHALMLIRAYRVRGHRIANLDPLGLQKIGSHPELDPKTYGFGPDDMDREIFIDGVLGLEFATLSTILDILKRTYCSTLGVQFMQVSNPEEKAWIQERLEGPEKEISFSKEGRLAILQKLVEGETFEPVFHVNGDDPEAVVYAARVATEYRQKFGKDVVLDIICYRRYGHNEGDDPSFTQPLMYQAINGRPSTRQIYAERLIAQGDLTEADAQKMMDDFYTKLDHDFEEAKSSLSQRKKMESVAATQRLRLTS